MAPARPASTAAKPPRSRLSPPAQSRPAQGSPFLFEALRELSFETCLEVAGSTLRIGLAATHWQLEQARILLGAFDPATRKHEPLSASHERAVALALNTSLGAREGQARAVITLRRDSPAGLSLDSRHHATLERLRAQGAQLVEVEHLAFAARLPLDELLKPMTQALAGAVRDWGSTDILAECPRQHAAFYCSRLGFRRLHSRTTGKEPLLLHLPAAHVTLLRA